jgi:dTDP-glucose 4,6-dehydratase
MHKGRIGEIYNIGADNEIANIDLAKKILNIMDKPEKLLTSVKDRPGHDRRYAICGDKLRRELGWKPKIKFDSGLKETVNWYSGTSK